MYRMWATTIAHSVHFPRPAAFRRVFRLGDAAACAAEHVGRAPNASLDAAVWENVNGLNAAEAVVVGHGRLSAVTAARMVDRYSPVYFPLWMMVIVIEK